MKKLTLIIFIFGFFIKEGVCGINIEPTDAVSKISKFSNDDNLALNKNATGVPSPLGSSRGWGGGSFVWEIVDGIRTYEHWAHGLAFCGGKNNWCGEKCGWREVIIDFGSKVTVNRVIAWHHGIEHVPNTYKIQYWDGFNFKTVFSTENGKASIKFSNDSNRWWENFSIPVETYFDSVTTSKIRYLLNNCDIEHGWIYEFEVYGPGSQTLVTSSERTFPINIGQPPELKLLIKFFEPSGNNMLDGDEEGKFVITVENTGKGTAYDVYALIELENRIKGLSWQNKVPIGDIPAGKKATVYADVRGGEDLLTDKAVFKITALEANGFDAEPVKVVLNTKSFEAPRIIVADIGIEDQNGNLKIEPLEMIETTVRIQNAGFGDARNVVVDIEKGENVFIGGDIKTHFEIGNLRAGEFKDIKFLFYTNKRIKSGEKIPLKVRLSEARKKFNSEHSLNFVMNAPQKSVTEVVIQGIETPKKEIEIATGLSVDVDINIPKGMMAGKDDIAVVIGNKNYTVKVVPHVEFADRDARIVKEYLITTFGFNPMNIIYEEDATLSKFNEIFGTANQPTKSKLYNWIKKGVSKVFIYYTGHGAPDVETGDVYLMPVDADPQFISINGYNLETFYSNLAQLPAKEVIVVLDACFSGNSEGGSLLKNISPAMIKVKKAVAPPNATIITSASVDQVSVWYREKKHSLFTYYFLKAIGGDADVDKDSRVTLKELKDYLNEHVPYMSSRIRNVEQNPVILSVNPDQTLVRLVK